MFHKLISGCIGLFWSTVLFAGTLPVVPVAPNQTTFEVQLAGNPTTGFAWTASSYDHALLQLTNTTYQPTPHPQGKQHWVGSGGKYVFSFACLKTKRPKQTSITFVYKRPWEKAIGKTTQVLIMFTPDHASESRS